MTTSPSRGTHRSTNRKPSSVRRRSADQTYAPPADRPLDRILSYRIARLHHLIGRTTANVYADEGLSSHQWKVMSVLYHYAPMSASDVRPWVSFDKSAISQAVKQLLEAGLVVRRLHERDGRAIYIELTPKGRRMSERMTSRVLCAQDELLASVSAQEKEALFPLLDQLDAGLQAIIARGSASKAEE